MNKTTKAEALLVLLDSIEGETILTTNILHGILHRHAEQAIEENNKGILRILLCNDSENTAIKTVLHNEMMGEKHIYPSVYEELANTLSDTAQRIEKYADFIANAPDDDTPESDEERELKVSIRQTVRENIDHNSKDTERFEKMYELDKKLCACRKSHAIDIVKCDPSFRFRYDANAFRKHYYNGSVFDGNMDYNKFVAALRKLSSDILRHANSIKDAQ